MKSTSSTSTKQSNGKPKSVEQTTAAPTTAPAKVKTVDPQIEAAKQALLKARADKKAAEEKAKEQRKAERAAKAAERAAVKAAPRPTCTGTKKDGSACTAKAKEGSERCIDHQPAILRLSDGERTVLKAYLRDMTADARLAFVVEELGWFRARQLVKEQIQTEGAEGAAA